MAVDPTASNPALTPRQPLRLWPGVLIVTLQWLAWFGLGRIAPEAGFYGILAGAAGGLLVILWWLFFSRAPWSERLGAVAIMAVALAATPLILHESIAKGAMGMLFYLVVIPFLSLAFVLWAVFSRRLATGPRWLAMAAAIFIACGGWALVRTGGFDGSGESDFAWRWSPTHEERLIATAEPVPEVLPAAAVDAAVAAVAAAPTAAAADTTDAEAADVADTAVPPTAATTEGAPEVAADAAADAAPPADPSAVAVARPAPAWPGFRGPGRDGVVTGARIVTDWTATPPVELWRRPVGPGWSSFAVDGDRVYTQEQRGEDEVVAAYDAATGEPLWMHRDAVRFWESNAGAGPRGTPTLAGGRVYTLGATGLANALDAATGAVVWSRDAAADTGAKLPMWGFSGSPLVLGDLVLVAASGTLVAYDRESGATRWLGPEGGPSYSSPHLATIGGTEQVLLLSKAGITSFAPADGTVLWRHDWNGYPIVQPALTPEGDVLLSVSDQSGLRRLAVARGAGGWSATERWTSQGLKPYFNDFVVHEGHAYGFDGGILAAIDLADGERDWKGGRYGHGQLVLLPEQDVLLVLGEKGELALVGATPDGFRELARLPAIEGKTWNHPVLAGDVLLARNGEEMVAFRLPRADDAPAVRQAAMP